MMRQIGRIDGVPGRSIAVSVDRAGGGAVELEMRMDGTTMRMRLAADQAAELERLLGLAQFRSWFFPRTVENVGGR